MRRGPRKTSPRSDECSPGSVRCAQEAVQQLGHVDEGDPDGLVPEPVGQHHELAVDEGAAGVDDVGNVPVALAVRGDEERRREGGDDSEGEVKAAMRLVLADGTLSGWARNGRKAGVWSSWGTTWLPS